MAPKIIPLMPADCQQKESKALICPLPMIMSQLRRKGAFREDMLMAAECIICLMRTTGTLSGHINWKKLYL